MKYYSDEDRHAVRIAQQKECVQKNIMNGPYYKDCPRCKCKMKYPTSYELNRSIKGEQKCHSCKLQCAKPKIFTDEHRKNLSIARTGKPMSLNVKLALAKANCGRKQSKETLERRSASWKQYIKENGTGTWRIGTAERLRRQADNNGQTYPCYNPAACKIIEEYGKKHGYNFQHAENGGEFCIKELGYFVDGYDKEKNVVIEYYEKRHNNKKKALRDVKRQDEIVNLLGCKFIILTE